MVRRYQYFALFIVFMLTGCSLAPHYVKPTLDIPPGYKETGTWLRAKSITHFNQKPWWEMYGDHVLNQLEFAVSLGNQPLKAALARYEQAKAEAAIARADLFPNLLGVGNGNHLKTSRTVANPPPVASYNDALLTADLTYQIDVWGGIRSAVNAANHAANASAADLAVVDLSLHAELAIDYFSLRSTDEAERILNETVHAYQRALYLTQERLKGGAVSVLDVDEAKTQLDAAKTLAADMHLRRMQLEHAIAILIGQVPADFHLSVLSRYRFKPVIVAPYFPSTLLEKRPDIARDEQLVEAANAEIGVARAAFFPRINLTAGLGFESRALSSLFKTPSLIWSLGPSALLTVFNSNSLPLITQTIFDAGRLEALDQRAWARYCETVANYKQTVLTAFQDVEDNLSALRQLSIEHKTQNSATQSAERALQQAFFQYQGGLTTYLNVVVIQTTALQNELSLVDVNRRRQIASVQLIKALGGGWQ